MSKMKIVILRVYHVLSLLSVCLSLTSVVTSQAGTALLLVNENQHVVASKSIDAYTFLRTHMHFEFIMTRWSFIMSILLFLLSTTIRMILEFGLFTRTRRLAGTMVVSSMAGFISFLLSYVNTSRVTTWPNLWCTTKEVALLLFHRARMNRYPLENCLHSFLCDCRALLTQVPATKID
jgi:hypothetical protein